MDTAEASQPIQTLDQLEKRHVGEALKATLGNVSQAARLLGVNKRTLYRMLARHGISYVCPTCKRRG